MRPLTTATFTRRWNHERGGADQFVFEDQEERTVLEIKAYEVVRRAVEEGAALALKLSTTNVEWPHWESFAMRDELAEAVAHEIMSQLCEVVDFGGEGDA